jgi:hypothetical protein
VIRFFRKAAETPLPPEEDKASLGNLAISLGYITTGHLHEALEIQKSRRRLGEILISLGYIGEDDLEELLFDQKAERGCIGTEAILAREKARKHKKLAELGQTFKDVAEQARDFTSSMEETAPND